MWPKNFVELWSGLIINPELIRTVTASVKKDGSNQIVVKIGFPNEDTITVHTLDDATADQYEYIKKLLVGESLNVVPNSVDIPDTSSSD